MSRRSKNRSLAVSRLRKQETVFFYTFIVFADRDYPGSGLIHPQSSKTPCQIEQRFIINALKGWRLWLRSNEDDKLLLIYLPSLKSLP